MIDADNINDFLDQVITNDDKPLDRHVVIRAEDFQMSTINFRKTFLFEIFLLVDGIPVPRSNEAVHMAIPADGVFVLYELKDMKVPWKDIDGCRIRTFDKKGNVEVDTVIKFYGLSKPPRRCVLMENDGLSRAIVAWHTRPPLAIEPGLKPGRKPEAKSMIQEEEDAGQIQNQDHRVLPSMNGSSVNEIMARLLGREDGGEDGDLDPVLPP